MNTPAQRHFTLEPANAERLADLSGCFNEHLRQIELRLGVEIANRGHTFHITGPEPAVTTTETLLRALYAEATGTTFNNHTIQLRLSEAHMAQIVEQTDTPQDIGIRVKRGTVRGHGANQTKYLHKIATHDINFGIGPAGTGKTFLAVASAVEALNESRVQRLILVRPAVEAGEKLGFLPGDLNQKIDPYLRPLYDALYEMLGVEKVLKLLEKNIIEIAPLAYMRGRTLNNAFVILDEAQNTTIEQMKMFLTRLGFGSTAVVTGDLTQIDIPKHLKSGLDDAIEVLHDIEGISFTFFKSHDVMPPTRCTYRQCLRQTQHTFQHHQTSMTPLPLHPTTSCGTTSRIPTQKQRHDTRPDFLNVGISYGLPRTKLPAAVSFRKWVAATLQGRIRKADLAIRIVDEKEGRALNYHYRNKDYATNVLSFPLNFPNPCLKP